MHGAGGWRRLGHFRLCSGGSIGGRYRSRSGSRGCLGFQLRNAFLELLNSLEQYLYLLCLIERCRALCPGSVRSKYHHHEDRQSSAHESLLCYFLGSFSEGKKSSIVKFGIRLPNLLRQIWLLLRESFITLECAGDWSVFYASRLDCQNKLFARRRSVTGARYSLPHPESCVAKKK